LAQKSREATLSLWIWIRMDPHHFGKLNTDPHQKGDPNSIKVMRIQIWDPVDPWIRDPGWVKIWIRILGKGG
jgi:hypothetical protein